MPCRNIKDSSLIFKAFNSWKEAITHEQTTIHRRAVEFYVLVECWRIQWLEWICQCRFASQCYDIAASMAGSRNDVATQIASEELQAIIVHCYGHALNLAAGDNVKKNNLLQSNLNTTLKLSKLLKPSCKKYPIFVSIFLASLTKCCIKCCMHLVSLALKMKFSCKKASWYSYI